MDYYQVLRVAPNASRKEIEQAYQRLLKESRYDTTIDRHLVENAYRTLSDLNAKDRYDAHQTFKTKREVRVRTLKLQKFKTLGVIGWIERRTLPQLLATLAVVLTFAIVFYTVRFGYLLREFHAGDVLYDTLTEQKFGKVLRVEANHDFGTKKVDAYQIELSAGLRRQNRTANVVWLPQESVKRRCYKKE